MGVKGTIRFVEVFFFFFFFFPFLRGGAVVAF